DVAQRLAAVDLRLAHAEHVEVGPVEHEHDRAAVQGFILRLISRPYSTVSPQKNQRGAIFHLFLTWNRHIVPLDAPARASGPHAFSRVCLSKHVRRPSLVAAVKAVSHRRWAC